MTLSVRFLGQTCGSGVGTRVYTRYGWWASQGCALGYIGLALVVALSRGPFSTRWIGWDGGLTIRKPSSKIQMEESVESSTNAGRDGAGVGLHGHNSNA